MLDRLTHARKALAGTKFDFREGNDCVETICPWGNRIHMHTPDEDRFGRIVLGMPYIRFDVRPGTAERIARFYREVLHAPSEVIKNGSGPQARVQVGEKQYFYFRETDVPEAPYDNHHVQIYIADFSGPHRRLQELGLVTMETNQHEYRFKDIDRSRQPRSAFHRRTRDTQPDQSDVWPAADQPQSGADQYRLQARPRQHILGDVVSA